MKIRMFTLAVLLAASVSSAQDAVEQSVLNLIKSSSAKSFSLKDSYGSGIDKLYLGYDENNTPVAGVAVRQTKTYKDVTTVVLVSTKDGGYVISAAEVPDMEKLPGKSADYVKQALQDISGKTLADETAARGLVDAVTGATPQYKAIYVSYSLMSMKVIEELKANPAWERKPLATK